VITVANKIIQLQNKTGDNLFPVAGSMKGDSVTTAMLQDDAVTNAKIAANAVKSENVDFTTYNTTPVHIGTWHDGKELWRKTLTADIPYTAGTAVSTSVSTGITTYSEFVGMDMRIDSEGNGQTVDVNNYYNDSNNYFRAFLRTNTVQIRMKSPNTNTAKCTFTVYYTVSSS
jgi:hypothetical protein